MMISKVSSLDLSTIMLREASTADNAVFKGVINTQKQKGEYTGFLISVLSR